MASELPPGWSYAVRLSPEARVCCDGGDNACASVTWDESIVAGSVAPPLGRPIKQGAASRELQFALSSLAVPPEVSLDPRATASSAFLVRATRLLAGATSSSRESEPITCTLTSGDATVATGTLRIQPGLDNNKAVTRISSGTLGMKYRRDRRPAVTATSSRRGVANQRCRSVCMSGQGIQRGELPALP